MSCPFWKYTRSVFRGYGLLFLINSPTSGLFFFLGLFALSPVNAMWSLLAATFAMVGASLLISKTEAWTGLPTANGVLIGYAWIFFPDIPADTKISLTLFGVGAILIIFKLSSCVLKEWQDGILLFSLLPIIGIWINAIIAASLGLTDPALFRGWHALLANAPAEARAHFSDTKVSTPSVQAQVQLGLAWTEFYLENYSQAKAHFQNASAVQRNLPGAYNGAGWSAYRLGEVVEAESFFRSAVSIDPFDANAWDGLGWIGWAGKDFWEATYRFSRCLLTKPLMADAHYGLALSLAQTGNTAWSVWHYRISYILNERVPPLMQQISGGQIIFWLFFFAGMLWHSHVSAGITIIVVLVCGVAGSLSPFFRSVASDPLFLVNLILLCLALSGKYMRVSLYSVILSLLLSVVLVLMWKWWCTTSLAAAGLPVLYLPFSILLNLTLVFMRLLSWSRRLLIPPRIATSAPEEIRMLEMKIENMRACCAELEAGRL